MESKSVCCQSKKSNSDLKNGFLLGLLPHSFCIAFILFSVLGLTTATAFLRRWLMTSYFFYLLILISLTLATLSALIYLKRNQALSLKGIQQNRRYLSILYLTMIGINLFLFSVVFPFAANLKPPLKNQAKILGEINYVTETIKVKIPCSGHAPLIIDELRKANGVIDVKYRLPDFFEITYSPQETSIEEILNLEIFKEFPGQKV